MPNQSKPIPVEGTSGNAIGGSHEQDGYATHFYLWLAGILAVAGATYIDVAWSDPFFQRAEDFFAESAREMFALSRFITPFMYGKPFIDKPIISYWGMEASFALLGVSHFTARLPFVLAALATAALTACAVARIWGRLEGLVAAAVLCSSFGFFYFATLSMSDMWLTFFYAAAGAWIFAGSVNKSRRNLDWGVAAVFCALAVLSKGPVGVLLPVAAAFVYLGIRREFRQVRLRHLLVGAASVLILAGGWFALLWEQTGSTLVRQFFFEDNLRRFEGLAYQININRPFGFIPASFLLYFVPWTVFLPFVLGQSWRKWREDWDSPESRAELFLWCNIATIIGFFWSARSVNDYYVLPAMPACAALAGVYLTRAAKNDSRVLRTASWFLALFLILAGAGAGGFAAFSRQTNLRVFLPLLLWICLSGAVMAIFLFRGRYGAVLAVILLSLCVGSAIAAQEITPIYARTFPLADLARAVQGDHAGKALGGLPLAISGDLEHWRRELAFQTGRVPDELDTQQQFAEFLLRPGPRLVLLTDEWMGDLAVAGQVQVIYQTPILLSGAPLGVFLDPARLQSRMKRVSWIYVAGAAQ